MKFKLYCILFLCLGMHSYLEAQKIDVTIEDFIIEHEGLDHQKGEIVPININEIKRKIRFFIEKYFNLLVILFTILLITGFVVIKLFID